MAVDLRSALATLNHSSLDMRLVRCVLLSSAINSCGFMTATPVARRTAKGSGGLILPRCQVQQILIGCYQVRRAASESEVDQFCIFRIPRKLGKSGLRILRTISPTYVRAFKCSHDAGFLKLMISSDKCGIGQDRTIFNQNVSISTAV